MHEPSAAATRMLTALLGVRLQISNILSRSTLLQQCVTPLTPYYYVLLLLFPIAPNGKKISGVSLKTQELCLLVFLARYLDLCVNFVSRYNR